MDSALLLIAERRGMVGDSVSITDEDPMLAAECGIVQTDRRGGRDFRSRRRAPPWC